MKYTCFLLLLATIGCVLVRHTNAQSTPATEATTTTTTTSASATTTAASATTTAAAATTTAAAATTSASATTTASETTTASSGTPTKCCCRGGKKSKNNKLRGGKLWLRLLISYDNNGGTINRIRKLMLL
ncbi:uncharacterized protein Dwil_GK12129 [Drosophila willistoni]|uniref:Uncharacterized protein n=1 Tax=Drosophila willistoni TaxID=7260 RepID=B4N8V4_DROWI|nr:protein new-glue 1 [Drosophila willistoni]EDW81555.2 uncharacterized protein Dwil_GK12129 [Drosophila willistoni]